MRYELLRRIPEALMLLSVALTTPQHNLRSVPEKPIVHFEELAEVCSEPEFAYRLRSNQHEMGELSTVFDRANPEQHGQLTAVLTHQNWDRAFLPQPIDMEYPTHDFGTRLAVIAQTGPNSASIQLSLTELSSDSIVDEAIAEIPLNDEKSEGTPVTFCWAEGQIRFLTVGNIDPKNTEQNTVYTVAK